MSISITLSNAISGLTAASRSAQIVSTNIANATTEGYARREIELSARNAGDVGAGVAVDGVMRIVDETLVRERRLASSALGEATEVSEFHRKALDLIGEPQNDASLSARVAELDRSLLAATSRPESDARLQDVLQAATSLTGKLNDISDGLQTARQDADRKITQEVGRLNDSLEAIAELNAQILRAKTRDQDYPSLLDSRQKLIDDVSDLVPIRELKRENDTVAIYSMRGTLLVDLEPARFEFTETGFITADMTIESGALSRLSLNGSDVDTQGDNAPMVGGLLSALFAVRDVHAPELQSNVDTVARDLVSRFEDPTMDPTLATGDPGLFTDRGSALDPGVVVGLSSRIDVNVAANPSAGGEVWRLRDGLGATTAGPVGYSALLDAMHQKTQERQISIGGTLSLIARPVAGLVTDLVSFVGQSLEVSNKSVTFQTAQFTALDEAVLSSGVDTDQELQKFLLVEQSFAANARVIQTADELMQMLIGL
ncbi:MAG: flagellar hook-associated protein FlgK [Paracoccaceae bacterium]